MRVWRISTWVYVMLACFSSSCQPVPVRAGARSAADVGVPAVAPGLNLVAIGIGEADRPIVLRPTGLRIERGRSAAIGVAGPGVEEGTSFAMLAPGFGLRLVRFATTQGGQGPIPAAVLALEVGSEVAPGLYSLIAIRGTQRSVLTGGIEVF